MGTILSTEEVISQAEAMEKQVPQEPVYDGDGYAPDGTFVWDEWLCPRCRTRYEVDFDDYNYCPNCGQRIKWRENDERFNQQRECNRNNQGLF